MSKDILYLGCYTPDGNSGIVVAEFDNQTGSINEINQIDDLADSSFLAISDDKNYLLAVSEHENEGQLGCFDIRTPQAPIFINQQSSLGGSPCHISVSATNAFISNYGTGNVAAFSLSGTKLLPAYYQVQHKGQGGNLDRQASAHAHASQLTPDEQFLVVADLGIDALKVYKIGANALSLVFSQPLPPADGPRHITFNANGDKLYLGNELSSTVVVFDVNLQTGALLQVQRVSSLPTPNSDEIESYIAEVALSNDGLYLYVSNRGHDSITIYAVEPQSGLLSCLEHVHTGGNFPRHFALSPDQRWLLVAHQNSENLVVFKRDVASGALTKTANQLLVNHAVCVCFYEK
ncbi:hypothetical protein CW745_01960 [Psychromonas sp. psych-6C06]|uniref:lactonase family protein n=1 Tax=Psychromonas sp. psych-6C06 TaxID=2058089 RepID=UPI000C331421|nr:lactonase family protein [Psychromonas sp. psych-6C06]PKF63633.1 hypothetical protein CW745_01960 [Psychromonas sp. psych-6C06]